MNESIFFQCVILSNEDPLMLGRIRGVRLIDNYDDITRAITDPPWNEEKDIWTERDPFIFVSLLPYFVYQIPKKDELVLVIYMNKDYRFQNQYYIQSTFYSPTATKFQYYQGANKFTGTGMQIKNPLPLKNQDGTYTAQEVHKGVFPQPGDNAILGRGSSDLIVKQDEVLLRAGKFKSESLQSNVIPVANQQRGFLQLSRFQSNKIKQPDTKIVELKEEVVFVKYLIEWVITNPENTQDKFAGSVFLYQLKPDISTNSTNLTVNSAINEGLKQLVTYQEFALLSLNEVIVFINKFIKTCNDTNVTTSGNVLFIDNNNKFPIFYRPNNFTYSFIQSSSPLGNQPIASKNITNIFNQVKLLPSLNTGGYGLIYAKGKVGKPMKVTQKVVQNSKYFNTPTTYGALGSDKLFLLSHNSAIPGKGKINFDGTLYGISVEKFADEILPKTSSMVRGEELMELINLIVRFLVTHTHAYPGLPPVPVTQDGSTSQKILTELQNAVNKILNADIRIN